MRYGTMREVTLGLTVVTPRGEVIRTGGRARKSSSGYDLIRLYVGSEGTLGIITELQLRLFGITEAIAAGLCQFDSVRPAIEAVIAVLQMGLPVARIEFLDALQMEACIAYSRLDDLDARATLFFKLHGSPASVADQRVSITDLLGAFGGGEPRWAQALEEQTKLGTARHNAYWAARALGPAFETISTDACIPIPVLPTCSRGSKADAKASGLLCPVVGHVGDGNFHMLILHRPGERAQAEVLAIGIARRAIAAGGTATGEHGIGLHRMPLLLEEPGAAVGVMRTIKQALDPLDIINPGTVVPPVPTTLPFAA